MTTQVHRRPLAVYISGPIKGCKDGNRAAFAAAAKTIAAAGDRPVNPHDLPPICSGNCTPIDDDHDHAYACYMRADLAAVLDADAVVLLPGWAASRGVMWELSVAQAIDLPVWTLNEDGEVVL